MRSSTRRVVVVVVGLALAAGCSAAESTGRPSTRTERSTTSAPTTSTTVPSLLTPIERPVGASVPGTEEWYQAPAPNGYSVTLGVFRPPSDVAHHPSVTVVILPGGDGLRRIYEDLAQRFANAGFIAVLGAWYEHDEASCPADAVHCVNAPPFTGMNAGTVQYIDALVAATADVRGVHADRLAVLGHSYGAGVALLRAPSGAAEPVVSSAGLVSRTAIPVAPLPTDEFPSDVASTIRVPVLVVSGESDPITPRAMAEAFVAAMPLDNPAATLFYGPPAGHALAWQGDALPDRPNVPVSTRYVEDVGAWIRAQFD